MLTDSFFNEDDVWVNKVTDDRYFVHGVQNTVEIRGVPVISDVELRPIPFSSSIYKIEIPEQLDQLLLTF